MFLRWGGRRTQFPGLRVVKEWWAGVGENPAQAISPAIGRLSDGFPETHLVVSWVSSLEAVSREFAGIPPAFAGGSPPFRGNPGNGKSPREARPDREILPSPGSQPSLSRACRGLGYHSYSSSGTPQKMSNRPPIHKCVI